MIYRHKFFSLDSGLQIVFDNDQKELRIIGRAYALLFALCEKETMLVMEMAETLALGKEYHGRKITEAVEKINHAIGIEIVVFSEVEDEFETRKMISLEEAATKEA